jgi:hypothetical protein
MSLATLSEVPLDADLFLFRNALIDCLSDLLFDILHVSQHAVDVKVLGLFLYFFELSQGHSFGLLWAGESKILIQVIVLCVLAWVSWKLSYSDLRFMVLC